MTPLDGLAGEMAKDASKEGCALMAGAWLSVAAFQNAAGHSRQAAERAQSAKGALVLPGMKEEAFQDLPAASANRVESDTEAVSWLISKNRSGSLICTALSAKHGERIAAIFEFAVKASVLVFFYEKGATGENAFSTAALRRCVQTADLPAGLTSDLLKMLEERQVSKPEVVDCLDATIERMKRRFMRPAG